MLATWYYANYHRRSANNLEKADLLHRDIHFNIKRYPTIRNISTPKTTSFKKKTPEQREFIALKIPTI